jgi:vacuolar-type H+-ATPase subunit I/STV1
MELGSILILLAILLPVIAYLAQPILAGQGVAVSKRDRRLSSLEAERERLLSYIQEMDMDFTMGKIPREDYEVERSAKLTQGAEILKQIDALTGGKKNAERRAADPQERSLESELEVRVASLRKVRQEKVSQYCAQCGGEIYGFDRFCSACGAAVEPQETNS